LPEGWTLRLKSALLCAIALARVAIVHASSASSNVQRTRLAVDNDRLQSEVAMLREELRIKDARLARTPPAHRPHYPATERLAILALKAARGWSTAQAARVFLLTDATIASWLKRIDERGPSALVRLSEPVNRFPDFIRQVVQQLKCVCPTMGNVRIAQALCRAGLRLSASTARRFLRQSFGPSHGPPMSNDAASAANDDEQRRDGAVATKTARSVVAKHPHHVWHIDLTLVPTHVGFWVPWVPFSWLQCWPFAYWVAVVIDHFSRSAITLESFTNCPTCSNVTSWLDVVIQSIGHCPKYIISDKGSQFREGYCDWCTARGIKPRFGAVGQHGSIAIVERFILSLKNECTRRIIVPLHIERFGAELWTYLRWYDGVRPHQSLGGRTPNEVCGAAPSQPAVVPFEPRPALVRLRKRGRKRDAHVVPVENLRLIVEPFEGCAHLPIVRLERAA
jgi:transposase InsO family protein